MNKLIIKKSELIDAVKKVNAIYAQMSKKNDAIICFQACKGKDPKGNPFCGLTILHFNGTSQVSANIFCDLKSEIPDRGIAFMTGSDFVTAVMALSGADNDMVLITEEDNTVMVSVGDNDIKLSKKTEGIKPIPFDVTKKDALKSKMIISASELKKCAGGVLFAVLNDEEKALGGVGIVVEEQEILFHTTDSRRVAESKGKLKKTVEGDVGSLVLSPTALKTVISVLGDGDVAIVTTSKNVSLQYGNDVWQFPLITKEFPHVIVNQIRAMKRDIKFTMKKSEILVALDIVAATSKSADIACRLFEENGKIVVYDKDKLSKAILNAEGDVSTLDIAFSVKLLRSIVNAFKGEKINAEMAPDTPCIFYAEGEELITALCPVKSN